MSEGAVLVEERGKWQNNKINAPKVRELFVLI
jgi:hypothetical protein